MSGIRLPRIPPLPPMDDPVPVDPPNIVGHPLGRDGVFVFGADFADQLKDRTVVLAARRSGKTTMLRRWLAHYAQLKAYFEQFVGDTE